MNHSHNLAPILQAVDLAKQIHYADNTLNILNNLSFTLTEGESLAIIGASGSGKSTLLGLLAGLDHPSTGHVNLLGQNLSQLDEDGRARLRLNAVSFVFQTFQLLPALTAQENVMLPLELTGNPNAQLLAVSMLKKVGLEHRLHHYPKHLSGGEQQRVALARAFVTSPKILFADEPTGNLDPITGHQIIELLFELNRELGTTLVLVTHETDLATRCDRIARLHAGQLEMLK